MTLSVIHDDEPGPALERCCFCRRRTHYWVLSKERPATDNPACCRKCAEHATPGDVPSKLAWCRREDIASGQIPKGQEPLAPVTPRPAAGVDRRRART